MRSIRRCHLHTAGRARKLQIVASIYCNVSGRGNRHVVARGKADLRFGHNHDAAGGAGYTHLTHRYQPWLDMSDHLNLNRAVLVGRVVKGASRLVVGGEVVEPDQQWVYYRIVLPVSPATGG